MELLTVVLTILADGGSAQRCQAIAGNTVIYLEGVEAVGFLRKEAAFSVQTRERETVRGWGQGKDEGRHLFRNPIMRSFCFKFCLIIPLPQFENLVYLLLDGWVHWVNTDRLRKCHLEHFCIT